jgi:hypothetical protein
LQIHQEPSEIEESATVVEVDEQIDVARLDGVPVCHRPEDANGGGAAGASGGMCSYGEHTLMGAEVSMTPALVPDLLKVMEAAGVLRVGRTTAYDLVGSTGRA